MNIRTIIIGAALFLGGCESLSTRIKNAERPLHLTLNGLKSEIKSFEKAVADNPELYQLSCDSKPYPNKVIFESIIVELATSTTNTSEANGGVEKFVTIGGKGSRSGSRADTLTLNLTPRPVTPVTGQQPYYSDAGKPEAGGIAEALLALMSELKQADDKEPCFQLKDENNVAATLKLAFTVERVKEVDGGVDVAIFKVGAKNTKNSSASNTVTVKIAIPGGATFN